MVNGVGKAFIGIIRWASWRMITVISTATYRKSSEAERQFMYMI